jgi:hypothetical protein
MTSHGRHHLPAAAAGPARSGRPGSRSRPALLAAVAGFLVGAWLSACGGSSPSSTAAYYQHVDARKDEIRALWMQIRQWRVDGLRLRAEPSHSLKARFERLDIRRLRVCPDAVAPQTDTCRDVCNLADAICDNAHRICEIARELDGDSWARDKCASAKASCKQARERCCECTSDEPAAEQPAAEPAAPGTPPAAPQP